MPGQNDGSFCRDGGLCPLASAVSILQADQKNMALEIKELRHTMASVEKNTEHLSTLSGIESQLKLMHNDLISAATGKRQIPLSSHLITIAILGGALLFVLVRDSNKNFKINGTGLVIEQQGNDRSTSK